LNEISSTDHPQEILEMPNTSQDAPSNVAYNIIRDTFYAGGVTLNTELRTRMGEYLRDTPATLSDLEYEKIPGLHNCRCGKMIPVDAQLCEKCLEHARNYHTFYEDGC